jgi:hypothetical protein
VPTGHGEPASHAAEHDQDAYESHAEG